MPLQPPHRAYIASQLVASLREAIVSGEWQDRLPSERTLAAMLRVSRATLRKALSRLEDEGLLAANPGNAQRCILKAEARAPHPEHLTVSIVRRPELAPAADLDRWQHRLQLRLTQQGIASNVLFLGNRQLHSKRLSPHNWTTGRTRRFWVLVGSTPEMQRWFAQHAPEQTLVVGTSWPGTGLPFIDRDYRSVGRHAAGFFLGRGHRRVALLGLKQPVIGDCETEAGFREVIQANAEARGLISCHDGSKQDLYRQLERLLTRREPPTALFMYKASLSLAAIVRLLQRGIQIPERLSLITRDENPAWESLPFDLAHYFIRPDQIVNHVIARINEHLEAPSQALPSVRILSQFHAGDTVTKPAGWTRAEERPRSN